MGKNDTCLRDCISFIFNVPEEDIINFIDYDNWIDLLKNFTKKLGYKTHLQENPLVIDDNNKDDLYLVWGTSVRGNYHSVVHKGGHLYYDPPIIMGEKEENKIIDKFHPNSKEWMFGVKNPYKYVWFEKIK